MYASHLHLTKFLLFLHVSFWRVQRYANIWWGILKSLLRYEWSDSTNRDEKKLEGKGLDLSCFHVPCTNLCPKLSQIMHNVFYHPVIIVPFSNIQTLLSWQFMVVDAINHLKPCLHRPFLSRNSMQFSSQPELCTISNMSETSTILRQLNCRWFTRAILELQLKACQELYWVTQQRSPVQTGLKQIRPLRKQNLTSTGSKGHI